MIKFDNEYELEKLADLILSRYSNRCRPSCNSRTPINFFTQNTSSLTLLGKGTSQNPLRGIVKISASSGNNLILRTDGLYASGGSGGDVTQYTDEMAQDAVGNILNIDEFTYDDTTPNISINQIDWSKITNVPDFIFNQFASQQADADFWIDGKGRVDEYLQVGSTSVFLKNSLGKLGVSPISDLTLGDDFTVRELHFQYDNAPDAFSNSYIRVGLGGSNFLDIVSQFTFLYGDALGFQTTRTNVAPALTIGGLYPLKLICTPESGFALEQNVLDLYKNNTTFPIDLNWTSNKILFSSNRITGGKTSFGRIGIEIASFNNASYNADLVFETADAVISSGNLVEYLRIKHNGEIIVKSLDTDSTAPVTSGTTRMVICDANGLLSFAPVPSGISSLGIIGSTPNANGATISGSTLNLEPASALFGGILTTGNQTIAGIKTLSSSPVFSSHTDTYLFYAGAGGVVTSSAALAFASSILTVNINAQIGGSNSSSGELPSATGVFASQAAAWVSIQPSWLSGNASAGFMASYFNGAAWKSAIEYQNTSGSSASNIFLLKSGGNVAIGIATAPTARLHLAAGTATAGTGPLKLTPGINTLVVENGLLEFDGTNLYFSVGGVRKTVTLV